MALPVLQHTALGAPAAPGPPAFSHHTGPRDRKQNLNVSVSVKQRPPGDDARRTHSLRHVKDSRENLRRTRARGESSATIESSTTPASTTAGRSFTVANINHGIIYLRYVPDSLQLRVSLRLRGGWRPVCLCRALVMLHRPQRQPQLARQPPRPGIVRERSPRFHISLNHHHHPPPNSTAC